MFSSRTLSCIAVVLTIVFLESGLAQLASADALLYTEDFANSTGTNQSFSTVGWGGYNGTNCIAASSVDNPGVGYFVASGSTAGFAMFRPTNNTGMIGLVDTQEFSAIDRSGYSSLTFSWYQWVDNTNNASQLAVKMDGTWYVSKDVFTNSDVLAVNGNSLTLASGRAQSLTLSSASGWYQMTVNPEITLSVGTTQVSLPMAGNIQAAGLYGTGTVAGTAICFDNYQISGVTIPEPGTMAMLTISVIGLLAFAWRKRR